MTAVAVQKCTVMSAGIFMWINPEPFDIVIIFVVANLFNFIVMQIETYINIGCICARFRKEFLSSDVR